MRTALIVTALLGACVIDSPSPVASRFQLAWTFEGGGDCDSLGVDVIQVNMLFAGGQLVDRFPCTDAIGVTHAVETEVNYSLQLVAYDADGNELGRSAARTESVLGEGQTVEVEPFVIVTGGG